MELDRSACSVSHNLEHYSSCIAPPSSNHFVEMTRILHAHCFGRPRYISNWSVKSIVVCLDSRSNHGQDSATLMMSFCTRPNSSRWTPHPLPQPLSNQSRSPSQSLSSNLQNTLITTFFTELSVCLSSLQMHTLNFSVTHSAPTCNNISLSEDKFP